MYSEPAKFVAKLRDMKTDDNILLFKCELGAGHFSKSGRYSQISRLPVLLNLRKFLSK